MLSTEPKGRPTRIRVDWSASELGVPRFCTLIRGTSAITMPI
jgi:hypothetical protein